MLWAAHQLESYKIFPLFHSVVAVKDTDSQISCSLLSPFWRATAFMETLSKHLEYLGLCGDDTEAEDQILESLNGILLAVTEDRQRSCHLLRGSGIFPALAKILTGNPRCAVKAAQVLSEIAKNEEMKRPCIEAGLVPALIPLLESTDPEMLLQAGRAIGRICYDNRSLQEELVRAGVIPSLLRILTDHAETEPLVHVALLALYNLADLDSAKEALSTTKVAEQLVKQLRRAESHERLEIVFEVLQALAENGEISPKDMQDPGPNNTETGKTTKKGGREYYSTTFQWIQKTADSNLLSIADALKVQLVDAGVPEALSEILLRLQGSSRAEDTCIVKAASDLIVSLLLGDGNCLRMFQLGVIHQLLDLLEKQAQSGDPSVQQAALSALQSLAVPVVSKAQVLEEGVAERIEALLRSESPPVQFKLLGTLRVLADGQADAAEILGQDPVLLSRLVQWCSVSDPSGICREANRLLASILHHNTSQEVVRAIQAAQGVKHLVSMTTSEHAALQNEALRALAMASAIDLETLEESFKESQLVQSLHKLLRDDDTSPEVKYNSMGLLCRLLNSGDLRQEIEEDKIQETLERLCSHSSADVAKEAMTTLQLLRGETPHEPPSSHRAGQPC